MHRKTTGPLTLQKLSFHTLCEYVYVNGYECAQISNNDSSDQSVPNNTLSFANSMHMPLSISQEVVDEIENVLMHHFESYIEPLIEYKFPNEY